MSNGFIQFGNGEPIPVADVHIKWQRMPVPDVPRLPLLSEYEVTLPLPFEAASRILRIVGEENMADRIDVAAHPDLAELDLVLDGLYGGGGMT